MENTIIIAEDISYPIDEGIKKFSFHLAKYFIAKSKENKVFSASVNQEIQGIERLPKNKLLFSLSFSKSLRASKAKNIIYIPSSSSTFMSFFRLKLIAFLSRSRKVFLVSVQQRKHGKISKALLRFLKPDEIVVLSNKEAVYYNALGIKCRVTPIGVDIEKFTEVNQIQKQSIRTKLGLPLNHKIVLHVGHINKGRNIGELKCLLKIGYNVVIIGSTRFESDKKYKLELEKEGFTFINHYIDKIEEYYQAADIYVFPVLSATSAMEFPLSVLEAMACNIPVITTKFGGIEKFLPQSDWLKYFSDGNELISITNSFSQIQHCQNRNAIREEFTWEKVFETTFQ
jgi:glycosyltransferase involved in cell wall biosynthesis